MKHHLHHRSFFANKHQRYSDIVFKLHDLRNSTMVFSLNLVGLQRYKMWPTNSAPPRFRNSFFIFHLFIILALAPHRQHGTRRKAKDSSIRSLPQNQNSQPMPWRGEAIQSLPPKFEGTMQLMSAKMASLENRNVVLERDNLALNNKNAALENNNAALIQQLNKEKEKMNTERVILNSQITLLLQQIGPTVPQKVEQAQGRSNALLSALAPSWNPSLPPASMVSASSARLSRVYGTTDTIERIAV